MIGDCRGVLKEIPDESVHCCVTSPPYYGLRDYGTATWEGGNPDCKHYVAGDGEPGQTKAGLKQQSNKGSMRVAKDVCPRCGAKRIDKQIGLEQTPEEYVNDLVEVFREVKRVLRNDGVLWLNLGDSYWGGKGKSSQAWSTSHQDRETLEKSQHQICGKGETRPTDGKHTVIKPKDLIGIPWRVAFALQADGWYLRQDIIWSKNNPMPESVKDRCTKSHEYMFLFSKSAKYFFDNEAIKEPVAESTIGRGKVSFGGAKGRAYKPKKGDPNFRNGSEQWGREFDYTKSCKNGRNKRDVWQINTKPYKGAHFATFPPALVKPCILAGCPENGVVLDPFCGSGTVGQVCNALNRNAILIELNPEYKPLILDRINSKNKNKVKKKNNSLTEKVTLQQNLIQYCN